MAGTKRHLFLLAGGVLGAAIGVGGAPHPVAADDAPDIVIDDFTAEATLTSICGSDDPEWIALPNDGSLLGEVDLQVNCPGDDLPTESVVATMGSGAFTVESFTEQNATAQLSWDGVDGSADVDEDGLGGIDLTGAGTKDAFTFVLSTGEPTLPDPPGVAGLLAIGVTSAGGTSSVILELPGNLTDARLTVPFALFDGTPAANFMAVGSIVMLVLDSGTPGPVVIGQFQTTTLARAAMTAASVDDADGDGRVTPGDTIEYTVTITNPADQAPVPATGATFSLPAPNGTFVPESVVTTQGAVTSGNDPGDTGVVVQLGDITDGNVVTISFRVLAGSPGPLANQGMLTYDGPGFAIATETDDPGTPAFSDDTVLAILDPLTVSIADAPDVAEGDGPATFTLTLSEPPVVETSVVASTAGDVATSDVDFVARSATITFAPGETTAEFTVDLLDDDEVEGPEAFSVILSDPVGALLGQSTAQATIIDDDVAPPTTPPPTTPAPTTVPPATTLPVPPTTVPLAPSVPPTLPATGSDTSGLVISALVMLGLGSAFVVVVRRRTA